ncbi:replicative DNA helicase [Proteus phage vB_PMC-PL1]|uniref:Uncharacterized protein n=1 Tax=Proteus phage PM135 TaxID=2048008 RepID=A0A2H4PRJ7_9CAUD|nr:hypothetical protein FDJ15_gp038 [Proteus phage PM135]ATW69921.1 hypothetical protein [Proteus phage PM135]
MIRAQRTGMLPKRMTNKELQDLINHAKNRQDKEGKSYSGEQADLIIIDECDNLDN